MRSFPDCSLREHRLRSGLSTVAVSERRPTEPHAREGALVGPDFAAAAATHDLEGAFEATIRSATLLTSRDQA
jgi:hypothetical protein